MFVCFGAEHRNRTVRIVDIIITVTFLIPGRCRPPAPERSLDFTGFGLHDGTVRCIDPFRMAQSTGFIVDPHGGGVPVESFKLAAGRSPGMGNLGNFIFLWITTVADDAAIRIYDQVLAADPVNTQARLGLARVVAWSGDLDRAEQLYDEILLAEPRNRDAVMGKIQVLHWGGRPLGATTSGSAGDSEDAASPVPESKP